MTMGNRIVTNSIKIVLDPIGQARQPGSGIGLQSYAAGRDVLSY